MYIYIYVYIYIYTVHVLLSANFQTQKLQLTCHLSFFINVKPLPWHKIPPSIYGSFSEGNHVAFPFRLYLGVALETFSEIRQPQKLWFRMGFSHVGFVYVSRGWDSYKNFHVCCHTGQ